MKRINYDVLSFLLQYFEEHMMAETHWSLKEKLQKKKDSLWSKFM